MEKTSGSNEIKRVVAAHDLSGFGRCALTVVIPALSAMGYQVVPMPTALLSTHTGGFKGFSFLDLSDEIKKFGAHWQSLGLSFDAIYTGFLGSAEQCGILSDFIDAFGGDGTSVLVDPVLGDNGSAYATVGEALIEEMKKMVCKADIITPNITEAHFLLGMRCGRRTESEIKDMLKRLSAMGPEKVVITGIRNGREQTENAFYDRVSGTSGIYGVDTVHAGYPGTGDLFASVLLGKMLCGDALDVAVRFASEYVREVISDTLNAGTQPRNGVLIEHHLKELIP